MRLLLREGFPEQALYASEQLGFDCAPPSVAAIEIEALRLLDRLDQACDVLAHTVANHAIPSGSTFGTACRALIDALGSDYAGWVGIKPDLTLTGDIRVAEFATSIAIEWLPGAGLIDLDGIGGWASDQQLSALSFSEGRTLTLRDGRKLIGSALRVPENFGLEVTIDSLSDGVSGALIYRWHPFVPQLRRVTGDSSQAVELIEAPETPGQFRFEIGRKLWQRITNAKLELEIDLPDGRTVPLPGSPFPLAKVASYRPARGTQGIDSGQRPYDDVAIILPVYSGIIETGACLHSLFATTPSSIPIVIVNDASPDPELARLMRTASGDPRVTLIENTANLGFPGSVNAGLAVYPEKNAVILNADTVVFGDWLERLLAHGRDSAVATITPLTNAGSIASYPGKDEAACTREEAAHLDQLAQSANRAIAVDVPTGVGFCMFMRRDAIDEVGGFDETLFATGYGEENDFCMRASASGWRHVIAADVFVQHVGGASFGNRKAVLMSRNAEVLAQRHPGYPALVAQWLAADPLKAARRNLDIARLTDRKGVKALLLSLAGNGGVARHVDERIADLIELGYDPILLRPTTDGKLAITLPDGAFPSLDFDPEADLGLFAQVIAKLDPAHVEVHHILGTDARFVDALLAAGKPVDFVLHDFGWYCTRVNLIDESNRYCGERGAQWCRECFARIGAIQHDNIAPVQLKERSERWFASARRLIVPSLDTQRRYAAQFPNLKFDVAEWEKFKPGAPWRRPRTPGVPLKVALLGAIGSHKGYRMLLDCARHAALNDLPLEFVVIGYTQDDASDNMARQPLGESGLVHVTGEYDEAELDHLIARERPDLFLFLSVAPETWCYTLTTAMRTGLPIVAVDQGAIGERLRGGYASATLLDPNANASQINAVLVNDGKPVAEPRAAAAAPVAPAPQPSQPPVPAPVPVPAPPPPPQAQAQPQQQVQPHIAQAQGTHSAPPGNTSIVASAEILNLVKGLYLFTVPHGGQPSTRDPSLGVLPALQVAPAPGASEEDYQFISATAHDGQWLTREGDSIVLKVKSAVTTVVVIILYKEGRAPLKIEVSKLDGETLVSTEPEPEPIHLQPRGTGQAQGAPAQIGQGAPAVPAAPPPRPAGRPAPPTISAAPDNETLRCQIVAHIENLGDAIAFDRNWVRTANGESQIEAFSLMPLINIAPNAIEYMAVTGAGMETQWLDQGRACGTRGLAMPLIGFAVRPRPGPSAGRFICDYYGQFASGTVVGPMRDGALCRSPNAGDPLIGLWVQVADSEAAGNAARPAGIPPKDRQAVPRGRKRKSDILSN